MGSYADFLGRYKGRLGGLGGGGSNPLVSLYNAINGFYNASHGGKRYALANLPVYGQIRNYIDQSHKAQDVYDRTGLDSPYIDRYQHTGTPLLSDLSNGLMKPMRMAKSLAKMYGVDVELDLVKEKHDAWDARNER